MTTFRLSVPIVSGVRTAVGRAKKGTLINTRPDDLLATVMNEAVDRAKGIEPEDVGDVVMGCAMPEGTQGMNIARVAVFRAGWPPEVTAETVNRFCASGLQAIMHGAQEIQCGQEDVVVAGGVESMSQVPMGGHVVSLSPHLSDSHPEAYISMGATAERVADQFKVTREDQDQYATKSHQKAVDAIKAGRFKEQIVPVNARVFKNG
ncbi:MAG: thiolase family protein, partial [Gammaproteobacteria bacterium]|nr:thiolase family protein [Gammaproteobacteria bacterium]